MAVVTLPNGLRELIRHGVSFIPESPCDGSPILCSFHGYFGVAVHNGFLMYWSIPTKLVGGGWNAIQDFNWWSLCSCVQKSKIITGLFRNISMYLCVIIHSLQLIYECITIRGYSPYIALGYIDVGRSIIMHSQE